MIVSIVIFLTTTISTAPVEGKNTSRDTQTRMFHEWRSHTMFVFPEKEQEEVEVEATEEVEGELSEEEEGRRGYLLF